MKVRNESHLTSASVNAKSLGARPSNSYLICRTAIGVLGGNVVRVESVDVDSVDINQNKQMTCQISKLKGTQVIAFLRVSITVLNNPINLK